MLLRLFILLYLFITLQPAHAQWQQRYLFDHIGSKFGLASDETMSIQQDPKGFLWIATLNGLQRYDGRRFISFRHLTNDANSIPNDNVYSILLDKKGRLWVRFAENRIGYFNTTDFTFTEVPLTPWDKRIKQAEARLMKDNHDNIMFFIIGTGVFTYDEHARSFSPQKNPFKTPANWKPVHLFHDKHDNYWIACDSGLVKYEAVQKRMLYRDSNSGNDPVIKALGNRRSVSNPFIDRHGKFWLYCWPPAGPGPFIFSYDPISGETKDWEHPINKKLKNVYHQVTNIQETSDGKLWLTGGNLFAEFDTSANEFDVILSNMPAEFHIRYDVIRELFEDREHNIWVCTNKGLYRFNPTEQFCQVIENRRPNRDTLFTPEVTDVLQTKNGEILVSTWGNGLFAYDNQFRPLNPGYIEQSRKLGEALTWCIFQHSNSEIWRGNQDGYLYISNPVTNKSWVITDPVFGRSTIRQITEDRSGNLWFGTHAGHVVKWQPANKTFSLIKKIKGTVTRLFTDKAGDVWVCSDAEGVCRINGTTAVVDLQLSDAGPKGKTLYKTFAHDIIQYNDSLYLIASGCLNLLNIKTKSIQHFADEAGYPSNNVANLVKDRNGYIWMTSMTGLCSVNFEKDVVTTYNERDGVHTNSFNIAAANMLSDGRVVIGTPHDMLLFNPDYLARSAVSIPPPDITITSFTLMNKRLRMDSLMQLETVELDYNNNSFVIEFSTLTYLNSYGIFYMMEGLDEDYKISHNNLQAIYTYLPPGTYTFKALCRNGDNQPSKNITLLRIRVNAPFWKTWWFYSLCVATVALLIFIYDKERMKRTRSLNKIRNEIAGNLHSEVNTALSNINVLSEMARMKADTEPAKSKEYIEKIHDKSHNMIIAMDDMLWSLSPENDDMEKTLERMKEYIDELKTRYGVNINITFDQKVSAQALDMKLRYEAYMLFKEGIRSLVQAGVKNCDISMDIEKNNLRYRMQFDNKHCDMQQLNNVLHRNDLEKNMRAMNATYKMQIHKTWSVFELCLPMAA